MRNNYFAGGFVLALGLLMAGNAEAQPPTESSGLKQQLEAVRAAQAAIQKDLQDIKALLQRLTASPPVAAAAPLVGTELLLEGAQFKGAASSQVVFVEFSDFQCPFCGVYAASSYQQITREYVDTGRLRYAFMSFPIESLHASAFKHHLAAACAGDQGRFWEMHDRLFANQKATEPAALTAHAAAAGLNTAAFRSCMESGGYASDIRRAMKTGDDIGVTGTPTFLIGVIGEDQKLKVAKVISGAKPYSVFKEAIDGVLATTSAALKPSFNPGW